MNKHVLVPFFFWLIIGCSNTRVFMGSYDSVSITVSRKQAEIVAENYPSETHFINGNTERKLLNEDPHTVLCNDSIDREIENGGLRVNIICPDKNLIKTLSDNFNNDRVVIEKRFHKPKDSTIISVVTIYPKKKYYDESAGECHLVTFKTKKRLADGSHRVLIKTPLVFTFLPDRKICSSGQADTSLRTVYISHCGNTEDGKNVVNDNKTSLHDNVTLLVLSKSISTMKKPVKITFAVSKP